ncbi:TRAP transporter large permease subunit [Mesorhizobium sp. BR1-1-13]|uniref:TRAP transporter large permease n=1 Tax=Mesorhizobium sp. BR1-1-13 TaxID=2876656 RepID=UPI00398D4EB7
MAHSSLPVTTQGTRGRPWLRCLEGVAAALVILDIAVLFAGVVARYVFDRPLIWSDELAAALFLWLGMLGAVLALSRDEHMRLSVFLQHFKPGMRRVVDAIASLMVVIFVVEIVGPAYNYVVDQWMIITPGLNIPDSYRVASILAGAVLLSIVALQSLFRKSKWRDIAIAVAIVAVISALLVVISPSLVAIGNWNLPIFFAVIVGALVVIGVPIAFAFGVTTLSYIVLTTDVPLFILVNQMDHGMSSLILLAIPLFIFLGLLVDVTGMAAALVNFLATLVGHFRGGLSYVLLGAMYLVSGISGAKAADMAAIAPVLLPEMKKRGYEQGETVALLASSSAMSETIPPSLILITIGSVTGVSIAALFIGGLLPAAVGAIALGIAAYFRTRGNDRGQTERAKAAVILKAFLVALPALVLPLVIRFSVVEGVATATEVSTVGVVYVLIVGPIFYNRLKWWQLYPLLVETAALSGAILLIIGTATGMGWALTQSGFASVLVDVMSSLPGGKFTFMALSIVLFAVLGSLLEGIPAVVLFGPLLFPVAAAVGIDEVHYAMVVILAMGLGLFSPPFGIGFYISCAIGKIQPEEAMGRVWPYLGTLLLALILIAAVPWISTVFL